MKDKPKETALANTGDSSLLIPSKEPILGQENISQEDILLPRIRLLQPLSEEVVSGKHQAGTFMNSLTGENLSFADVLIFYFFKSRIQFGDNLGEEIKCMSLDSKVSLTGNKCDACPEANWGVERGEAPNCDVVYNFSCIPLNSTTPNLPVVLSLKRTSIKEAKQLLSTVALAHIQWWDIVYHVSSELKKNDKGSFYVFKIDRLEKTNDEQRKLAARLYNDLSGKKISVHEDQADDYRAQEDK